MHKAIKVQHQIIADPNTGTFEEHDGHVMTAKIVCPFCGQISLRWTPKARGFEWSEAGCKHNKGLVDAGQMRSAVHFEGENWELEGGAI